MELTRVPNWDIALARWAHAVVGQPYVWGETDCGTLVRAAHEIMYGRDISNVDRYYSLSEAARTHAATGGVETLMRELGAVEVNPSFAQQGDVLIEAEGDSFPAAGVVVARSVIWATVEDGVVRAPLRGRTGILLRVPHG